MAACHCLQSARSELKPDHRLEVKLELNPNGSWKVNVEIVLYHCEYKGKKTSKCCYLIYMKFNVTYRFLKYSCPLGM